MSINPEPPTASFGQPDSPPPTGASAYPPSWSGTAIAGFVLSLLGCLVVTGFLGLVLGTVGIVQTRGGRRRGRGLAIAAVPISIVTIGLGLFVGYMSYKMYDQMFVRFNGVASLLESNPSEAEINDALQKHCSQDFRDSVSPERMREWLESIHQDHGTLVSKAEAPQPVQRTNQIALKFECKFVNGTAPIVIVYSKDSFELRVDDIEVDGQSPRP